MTLHAIVAGGWVLLLAVLSSTCFSKDMPISADTAAFLSEVDAIRAQAGKAGKKAAMALNRSGDHAYKTGAFDDARRNYWTSYPNFPNAYAYIMAGDAYWRGVIRFHARAKTDQQGCPIDNQHFPHDLEQDLNNHLKRGLALAVKDHDNRLIHSDLYQRAMQTTLCLQNLADFYRDKPAVECVDLSKIQTCLGPPLIK